MLQKRKLTEFFQNLSSSEGSEYDSECCESSSDSECEEQNGRKLPEYFLPSCNPSEEHQEWDSQDQNLAVLKMTSNLEKELRKFKQQIIKLDQQNDLKDQREREKVQSYKRQISSLEQENDRNIEKIDALQNKYQNLEAKYQRSESYKEELEERLRTLSRTWRNKTSQHNEFKKKYISLEQENSKLDERVEELEKQLSESQPMYAEFSKLKKDLKEVTKKFTTVDLENFDLKQEIKTVKAFYRTQIGTNNRLNQELKEYKQRCQYNGLETLKLLEEDLTNLFECPITLCEIESPAILPSGHTIEKSFMEELIKNDHKDPFDNRTEVNYVVTNRFAIKVKEELNRIRQIIGIFANS